MVRPDTAIVFLDQEANFTCEANGTHTDWKINGTTYNSQTAEARGDMNKDYAMKLTIYNTSKYNNTEVQCLTFDSWESRYYESNTATLRVQGNWGSPNSAAVAI